MWIDVSSLSMLSHSELAGSSNLASRGVWISLNHVNMVSWFSGSSSQPTLAQGKGQNNLTSVSCRQILKLRQTKCLPKPAAFSHSQLVMDGIERAQEHDKYKGILSSTSCLQQSKALVSLRWTVLNPFTLCLSMDFYNVNAPGLYIQVCLPP